MTLWDALGPDIQRELTTRRETVTVDPWVVWESLSSEEKERYKEWASVVLVSDEVRGRRIVALVKHLAPSLFPRVE